MMENAGRFKNDFEDQINQWRNSQEHHYEKAERNRKKNLAEVEACRGGYVEVEIGMVNIVETPEQRDAMGRVMPPVIRPIHEEKRHDRRHDPGQLEPVQQSDPVALGPEG